MPELAQIAELTLRISVIIQVFAIGLRTTWADATYLFRRPPLLLKSIFARNVAVPILAILLIKAFSIHGAVAIAMAVLAVTPVPPLLPKALLKAGARSEYAIGLLVSQAILAIVIVPATIQFMNWIFGSHAQFSPREVAMLMIQTILVSLGAGMLVARLLPALRHFAGSLMKVGTVLLLVGAIPLLLLAWKTLGPLSGNGTMLALVTLVIASIAIGHFLGGPVPEDRTSLAMATSARHPAVALAIARVNFPEQALLIAGAIVIYLLLWMILSIPYSRIRQPAHA